jgi:hypothetical protein
MKRVFTQTHSAVRWADGNTKLGGRKEHAQDFGHTCKTANVDLTDINVLYLKD